MSNKIVFFLTFALVLTGLAKFGTGCGLLTHIEIAFRALEHLNRNYQGLDIRAMLKKYPDALQAGAVYPDSYYNSICENGAFSDVSETSHWMEFVLPALDYFKQKYASKPIDADGERLLTFILGVVSHDVADVTWHGLGIDQGFIDIMRAVNFSPSGYQDAHDTADVGGDAVNRYEMVFPSSTFLNFQWYVPAQDVVNIYKNMGINFDAGVVAKCAVLIMKLAQAGEALAIGKGYPYMAAKSPFLATSLMDYFNGGVNEMADWVLQRWLTVFSYLENGSKNCTNSITQSGNPAQHNPFYWVCGNQPPLKQASRSSEERTSTSEHQAKMRTFESLLKEAGAAQANVEVTKNDQTGAITLVGAIRSVEPTGGPPPVTNPNTRASCPSNSYYLRKAYSTVGQTLLSADVNLDGNDDLIVGVPGYSFDNRFHEGRVFVVLGGPNGLPQSDLDLERADIIFPAPFTGSGRFGYSVAVLDFNGDGQPDIAISAPIYAPDITNAMYSGQVYVYYGHAGGTRFTTERPDVTIDCGKRFCNLGTTLSVGDVNRDGKNDLIIGSPYASDNVNQVWQNGFVLVYYSGQQRPSTIKALDNSSDITLFGKAPYSWFGYSAITTTSECNLLIGAPATKLTVDKLPLFMAGTVFCYNLAKNDLQVFASGNKNFQNFGSSLAFGFPNGKSGAPVVVITAANDDNQGMMMKFIPYFLPQSGSVYFYGPNPGSPVLGQLGGDRHFGRYGTPAKFVNYNNDGFDDLLVGSSHRPTYLTVVITGGEAVGEMFLYQGRNDFVRELVNRGCPVLSQFTPCPEEQANKVLATGETRAQFGTNAAVVRSGTKAQLVVTAPRSDAYARQSGKLVVYRSDC